MKKNIFLKLSILLSVCLCISLFCCREDETDTASDNYNERVHNDTDNQGNEQGTKDENRMILLCNLAKLEGKKFGEEYITPYLKGENNNNICSLYEDLELTKNMPMFTPLKELYDTATYHAEEMIEHKELSHDSFNGEPFFAKIGHYISNTKYVSENLCAGTSTTGNIALDFVIHF